jgi:hypothetical protein
LFIEFHSTQFRVNVTLVELIKQNDLPGTKSFRHFYLKPVVADSLAAAGNCGPPTTAEIIWWLLARARIIQRPLQAGKSLSAMWRATIAKFSSGEITKEGEQPSVGRICRRQNYRMPVAFNRLSVLRRPGTFEDRHRCDQGARRRTRQLFVTEHVSGKTAAVLRHDQSGAGPVARRPA